MELHYNGLRDWYFGLWLVSGKPFCVDVVANCTKFLGPVMGLFQTCNNISEDLK